MEVSAQGIQFIFVKKYSSKKENKPEKGCKAYGFTTSESHYFTLDMALSILQACFIKACYFTAWNSFPTPTCQVKFCLSYKIQIKSSLSSAFSTVHSLVHHPFIHPSNKGTLPGTVRDARYNSEQAIAPIFLELVF